MNKKLVTTFIGLAALTAQSNAALAIDFQPTGGTTAAGYEAFEFTTQGAFPVSSNYSAFGTTVSISVSSANVGDNNDNRSITRNGLTTDIRNDWLGVDARNTAGGSPEATFTITLIGLPAGQYSWDSILHDGGTGASGPGQGNIFGNIRTTFVDANGTVNGTSVISAENPAGGGGPLPQSNFITNFTSDGSPVSLAIGTTGINGDAIFALASSLDVAAIPEPSTGALGFIGLLALVRRRR
ncbi:PEP-CTERM sorting domain-containing protein [bacterium]|nr:PEP-CTERM sorting domain-containing protein [bacterium]MDC0302542.1 PEP-CTERM sorting domain-containing protein [bacterium]